MIQERWQTWTRAERMIVSGVAIFALLVALIFGIISPLQSSKQAAVFERDRAAQDVALVENGITALRTRPGSDTGAAEDLDRFRLRVTQLAQQRGLSIARLQNSSEGTVQLMFAEASPAAIYQWLEDIAALPGSGVISGSLAGREDGVIAEIELRGIKP